MLEQYAEQIVAELSVLLPEDWSRLVLFGLILPGSYELLPFVKNTGAAMYQDVMDLQKQGLFNVPEKLRVYAKIRSLCNEAQDRTDGEKWKTFTLVVERSGHFSIDYGYDDDFLGVPDGWREQYLV